MKRGRLPLTALRSFEAAGRLGSFTLAADELAVSQAAISRQVRELEALVGQPLFDRRHRGVSLTAAGAELLATLTRSFDAIEARLGALSILPLPKDIRISAEPSFAACWLGPRQEDFRQRHPEIDLVVEADPRLVAFRRGEPELAIRHGETAAGWPGVQSRHFTDVLLVPVLPPNLAPKPGEDDGPTALSALPLLHEENRDFWRRWFEAAGERPKTPMRGPVYGDSGLVLQATLRGEGAALLDEAFVEEALAQGRLLRLPGPTLAWGAYFLVARDFSRLPAPAKAFVAWIEAAFGVRDPA